MAIAKESLVSGGLDIISFDDSLGDLPRTPSFWLDDFFFWTPVVLEASKGKDLPSEFRVLVKPGWGGDVRYNKTKSVLTIPIGVACDLHNQYSEQMGFKPSAAAAAQTEPAGFYTLWCLYHNWGIAASPWLLGVIGKSLLQYRSSVMLRFLSEELDRRELFAGDFLDALLEFVTADQDLSDNKKSLVRAAIFEEPSPPNNPILGPVASKSVATIRGANASTSRADVLLVTVNKYETQAVMELFRQASDTPPSPTTIQDRVYHNLGSVNGTKVFHVLSEMGSAGLGATHDTVDKGIRAVNPEAVIAVGIAFGINSQKQIIGDILLSKQLRLYDLQRVGGNIILRGDKPHASSRLINFFESIAQTSWRGAVVRPGVILTGDKLVDSIDYRQQLVEFELEAVGGEMEGAGVYVACHDHKVDWIVIKAICDWADGKKARNKVARQKLAATNAVEFLIHALQQSSLPRYRAGVQA